MLSTSPLGRFAKSVQLTPGHDCWEWISGRGGSNGAYSQLAINGKKIYGHRYAYELFTGPIPDNLVINHLCRNKLCVNPKHLEATTQKKNIQHAVSGKPRIKICKRGHEQVEENIYTFPSGIQTCRPCTYLAVNNYNTRKDIRRKWPLGHFECI